MRWTPPRAPALRSALRSTGRRGAARGLAAVVTLAAGLIPVAPASLAATDSGRPGASAATAHPAAGTAAPRAAAPSAVFSSRITAGPTAITDRHGRRWDPQPVRLGSWRRSAIAGAVSGTADPSLYRHVALQARWYWLRVPTAGTYRVRLHLVENYWRTPGRRVFDVRAEGRVVARGVDIYRAAGYRKAHEVTFTVPVRDGELSLDFDARADHPAIAAIEVTSTAPVSSAARAAAVRPPARAVRFAPNSFYYTKVRKAPLAKNSARTAAVVAADVARHWGGIAAFNAYRYNTAFYRVPAGQPKVRVAFSDCQKKRYTPSGLFDGARHFVDVPVPPNAMSAAGTDQELTIYDPAADKLWEFWQMRRTPSGWAACWGGRLDSVSRSQGTFPWPYGASASGLVMAGGMITQAEFRAGRIDHAVYLGVISTGSWRRHSWPANRSDGWVANPDAPLIGQRLRLDPKLDVSRLGLNPAAEMVARAAQEYGFIVSETAGAVGVVTEAGIAPAGRSNPWGRLLAGPSYLTLQDFPWKHLQALPVDYGRPSG